MAGGTSRSQLLRDRHLTLFKSHGTVECGVLPDAALSVLQPLCNESMNMHALQ